MYDDTARLQAALDTVNGIAPGMLRLLPREYIITDSLRLSGTGALRIVGSGVFSRIINEAGAGKPTFVLTGKRFVRFENFAILGVAGCPNDAIEIAAESAFVTLRDLFLCPNGNGIHLADSFAITIEGCQYWPTGYNQGAELDVGGNQHFVLGDGHFVNDVEIHGGVAGYADRAHGGAGIKIAPSDGANNIVVKRVLLEDGLTAATSTAIDFQRVRGFSIESCYLGDVSVLLDDCRHGALRTCWGSTQAAYTLTRCVQVKLDSCTGLSVDVDAASSRVLELNGLTVSYTDLSPDSEILSSTHGGENVPDRLSTPAPGTWIDVPYNEADYLASTGTWHVTAANLQTLRYARIGSTLLVRYQINATGLSGGPAAQLSFPIPGGFTIARRCDSLGVGYNNQPGTAANVQKVVADTDATRLIIVPDALDTSVLWANCANGLYLAGQIVIETQ